MSSPARVPIKDNLSAGIRRFRANQKAQKSWLQSMPRRRRLVIMSTIAFAGAVMGASTMLLQLRLAHHPGLISKSVLKWFVVFLLVAGCALATYLQTRWMRGAMRRDELRRDLLSAQQVQQSLLPHTIPQLPNCSVAGATRMSRDIGGDYFDVIAPDENRMVLVTADVSGKGVPAALVMAGFQAIVRSHLAQGCSLPEIALVAHRHVLQMASGRYITAVLAELDFSREKLTCVNAGHTPLLILTHSSEVLKIDSTAMPIGLLPEFVPQVRELPLDPIRAVYLYTDGISERTNLDGEEFGEERLASLLLSANGRPPEDMVREIIAQSDEFAQGLPAGDDLTILVASVKSARTMTSAV
jgi:sigma-B regulation protein RsbU (phosphoserine phosphatase)